MGQLIDEEDCEVCEPFEQEWIFTYGDLVTLLLCFFILLFSMCRTDVEKLDQISESFKSQPPGSPFVFSGRSSQQDKVEHKLDQLEMPDDVTVRASEGGVEVSFNKVVAFDQGSTELKDEVKQTLDGILPIIGAQQHDILISGHTDSSDTNPKYPSSWEMSVARASVIAAYLETKQIPSKRIQIAGYGDSRPRFHADTPYKRSLNRRVQIVLLPGEVKR